AAEALRRRCHFDLLIVDIRLPGLSGLEWLRSIRDQGDRTDVIFMTAFADMDIAIQALRAGAADFLLKPFRVDQMSAAVDRCLERRRMERENVVLRREVEGLPSLDGIVGESAAIGEVARIAGRVAPTASTVLIDGETGTGKELVARAIHRLSGRSGPFVAVDCGAISPDLLESELFGHTKGAFTGAQSAREGLFSFAHTGTLFLDEIGEMPLAMQAKLLRALEERAVRPVGADREMPVDSRVIAATNQPLYEKAKEGRFREDLYYRLNVLAITMPPLRERLEDIPLLARHFMSTLASALRVPPINLTHHDIARLQGYDWPGNVREFRNVIERSLLLGELPADCCRHAVSEAVDSADGEDAEAPAADWTLHQVHKHHILRTLEGAGGNKSEAARRLGISRKTLERKLSAWAAGVEDE
ncbi:MAG TPA: sigma-54 dependent transcriptional regulator, partial [Gammaproteobacteria bacterium]|nr:sigma-54 dependent transcriptional regulator [Gammaproteobacteria bacterium]